MLTTDLIRARRRGDRLTVPKLKPAERQRMLVVAEQLVQLAAAHLDTRRCELTAAWDDVLYEATDFKRVKGLRKLLVDRCTFEQPEGPEPSVVRHAVFARAAAARQQSAELDAAAIYAAAADELQVSADEIDVLLYADLKENHRLVDFDATSGAALVDELERAQVQAVLLRAVKVTIELRNSDPGCCRRFFHALKFRRLLHTIERLEDGGYRIEIDGPFSLFSAVTKYGVQLALLLPALEAIGDWTLDAEICWGKERQSLRFQLEGSAPRQPGPGEAALPDEVAKLYERFARLETDWRVEVAHDLLDLPGIGVCVPDLVFVHRPTDTKVFFEVMGFWSRQAVWRRVELVEAGLPHPILFAVSSRLRVSQEVLGGDLPGQLYVYKGAMSARVVAERLDGMLASAEGLASAVRRNGIASTHQSSLRTLRPSAITRRPG